MSLGSAIVVLLALVALDQRVHDRVAILFSSEGPTSAAHAAVAGAHGIVIVLLDAARDQAMSHAALMVFVAVATLLVAFMLRT